MQTEKGGLRFRAGVLGFRVAGLVSPRKAMSFLGLVTTKTMAVMTGMIPGSASQ